MGNYAWDNTKLSYKDTNLPSKEDEEIIVIESDLRTIHVPASLKTIGVAGDHKAESIFFQIPRYFDGIDLSNHTCLIRFINAGKEYGEYNVTEIAVDEDFIVFGWQISNLTTRYHGTVQFTVQFETVDADGIEYQWQTVPAQLIILAALPIEETITPKDDTLYRKLSNRVDILEQKVNALPNMDELINEIKVLSDKVKYLEDNVVYTLSDV